MGSKSQCKICLQPSKTVFFSSEYYYCNFVYLISPRSYCASTRSLGLEELRMLWPQKTTSKWRLLEMTTQLMWQGKFSMLCTVKMQNTLSIIFKNKAPPEDFKITHCHKRVFYLSSTCGYTSPFGSSIILPFY